MTTPKPAYEWTYVEKPCWCSPEHRRWCARCNGTGMYKSARLRRVEDATTTQQTTTGDSTTTADHKAASA